MRGYGILLLFLLLATAFFYAPGAVTDLNSLLLEESLTVEYQDGEVTIAGEKLSGGGADWDAAMEHLYATAAGTVFLETTDRILIACDAVACLPAILEDARLRPATQLYFFKGETEDALTEFAAAHESGATIAKCGRVPVIVETGGGYCFAQSE